MGKSIIAIEPSTIAALQPAAGVELIRDLLWSEAARLQIPRLNVIISADITVKDGGIDASISAAGEYDSLLVPGECHYQIKTGLSFCPWQEAEIKTELFGKNPAAVENLGAAVLHCLQRGAVYSLVTLGHDLTTDRYTQSIAHLKRFFGLCGFPDARVQALGITHIIGSLHRHPSLCLDLNGLGDMPFQRVDSWAATSDMTPPLALGERQTAFIDCVQGLLSGSEIQHLRIVGEPGIGKSRLVLEAIRRSPELAANTLYVRQASDFTSSSLFTELLKTGRDYSVVLVVDECDNEDRSDIWRFLKDRRLIKLVTIDHGPATAGGTLMETLEAPPLEQGQIEQILAIYLGSSISLNRWARWCDGSARVAHAIGENLKSSPEDVLRPPDTVPMWDRFIAGYGEARDDDVSRVVLRHIALFEKFGARAPVEDEAAYIATLAARANPSITPASFNSVVNYYKKRRILQGDRTLRIVPKALQIYLWREWWESYGAASSVNTMVAEMPKSMQGWFMRLFIYAHNNDASQDTVKALLDPRSGLFCERAFLTSNTGSSFINVLAEADPASTVALLKMNILQWSDEELRQLKDARQNLAWALEKIAVWKEHFRNAVIALRRLSFGDTSNNTNNAKGLLLGLFCQHGATTLPLADRASIATHWLNSSDLEEATMGLAVCGSVLNAHGGVRILGVENQGMRPETIMWKAQTWSELITPWKAVFKCLQDARTKRDEAWTIEMDKALLTASESMARVNVLHDEVVGILTELAAREDNFEPLIQLINRLCSYPNPNVPDTFAPRLQGICDSLVGDTFTGKLRRYVLHHFFENDDLSPIPEGSGGTSGPAQIRLALAAEAAGDNDILNAALPALFRSGGYRIEQFGFDVASAMTSDEFDQTLLSYAHHSPETTSALFLSGYVRALSGLNKERWQRMAEVLIASGRRSHLFAVICSGMNAPIFEALMTFNETQGMDASCYAMMGYESPETLEGLGCVRRVLDALLARDDADYCASAVSVANRKLCKGEQPDPADEVIVLRVLTHPQSFTDIGMTMAGYYWHELANRFRKHFPHRDLDLFSAMVAAESPFEGLTSVSHSIQIANEICAAHPSETWAMVSPQLSGEHAWVFRNWLGGGLEARQVTQALIHFNVEDVFAWIDEDPSVRAYVLAEIMPQSLEQDTEGDITRAYLERYGEHPHVREHLMMRFGSGVRSGPQSEYLGHRQSLARRWMTETESGQIQDWLAAYIQQLSAEIEHAKTWEERIF
jgi:hypothetical protein